MGVPLLAVMSTPACSLPRRYPNGQDTVPVGNGNFRSVISGSLLSLGSRTNRRPIRATVRNDSFKGLIEFTNEFPLNLTGMSRRVMGWTGCGDGAAAKRVGGAAGRGWDFVVRAL